MASVKPRSLLLPVLAVTVGAASACTAPPPASEDDDDGPAANEGEGEGEDAPVPCPPPPACDAAPPATTTSGEWRHTTSALAAVGEPRHRGRDLALRTGDEAWALAKFAYGAVDDDLQDEDVHVYLLRGCGAAWEPLGTVATTSDGDQPTVYGVEDTGGRVFLRIPGGLGAGRHRLHFVVDGDGTTTEQFIEVQDGATPVFVTDIDGTLTTTENEEFGALLTGTLPDVRPDAVRALRALADRGLRPMYLTARPEWLLPRTRALLDENGFPPGLVHTTLTLTGATGDTAKAYKTAELAALATTWSTPQFAFGNTDSDAAAYEAAAVALDHRYFIEFDDPHGGVRVEGWAPVADAVAAVAPQCPR